MVKLENDNVNFLVPAVDYDVTKDSRMLIPFVKHQKVGFVNKNSEILVEAKYDIYWGDVLSDLDCVKVGTRYAYSLQAPNGKVYTYDRHKWGVIDSGGNVLVEPEYKGVLVSSDNELFTINTYKYTTFVANRQGEIIVPEGKYSYIDGFDKGFARVKKIVEVAGEKVQRWGIIDATGTEVLVPEYDNIWNFYQKNRTSTRVVKGNTSFDFNLVNIAALHCEDDICDDGGWDEGYGSHFGEYAGSYAQDVMGFSDDVIDDAFDGDPEAYWNID